jgi:signal transduction histidine kinase
MEYVSAILESVERLSRLINDVLDLTAGDGGAVVLEKERVDVAGLCRTATETARNRASERDQTVDAQIGASTGYIQADPRRLRESLEHVLNNAMTFSDRKGTITLTASGDDRQVVIAISDDGQGIAEQDLPRVFDRFDRVAEGSESGERALGLGLPLTRQFIEAHGGTVSLESTEGLGTTVTLIIPRGGA